MNLRDKTQEELLAMAAQIEADPANRNGKPGSLYLYTPQARRKLDAIRRAITDRLAAKRAAAGNPVAPDGYSGRQSKRRR